IAGALGDAVQDVATLARTTGLAGAERTIGGMIDRGELVALSGVGVTPRTVVMHAVTFDRARNRAGAYLAGYHARHPLAPGARREEIGAELGVRSQRALDELIHALADRGALRVAGATVALPE